MVNKWFIQKQGCGVWVSNLLQSPNSIMICDSNLRLWLGVLLKKQLCEWFFHLLLCKQHQIRTKHEFEALFNFALCKRNKENSFEIFDSDSKLQLRQIVLIASNSALRLQGFSFSDYFPLPTTIPHYCSEGVTKY